MYFFYWHCRFYVFFFFNKSKWIYRLVKNHIILFTLFAIANCASKRYNPLSACCMVVFIGLTIVNCANLLFVGPFGIPIRIPLTRAYHYWNPNSPISFFFIYIQISLRLLFSDHHYRARTHTHIYIDCRPQSYSHRMPDITEYYIPIIIC